MMVSKADPTVKVAKATEFQKMAEVALTGGCYDCAASLAVSAGVNAIDALCLHVFGRYSKAQGHEDAVVLVSKAGVTGRTAATPFRRLLSIKNKSQYLNARCSAQEATEAVKRASRILDLIRRALDET